MEFVPIAEETPMIVGMGTWLLRESARRLTAWRAVGTGYSSLSYLHRLPVGIVKIDRSFVMDVGAEGTNEPIVRAVLAMTRAMGQRVVAEGVETGVQRDWLRAQGCDLVQGSFYGKADRPENLTGWIEGLGKKAAHGGRRPSRTR
ncbi:EAL domain-containing protein [Actinoplanes sp. NPDC051343]|uniref:EAL domain-containing protein n=1 Tax=Actinoplanes sp. NPDC051343 TaxID=3363906 RepID=UPI0037B5FDAE